MSLCLEVEAGECDRLTGVSRRVPGQAWGYHAGRTLQRLECYELGACGLCLGWGRFAHSGHWAGRNAGSAPSAVPGLELVVTVVGQATQPCPRQRGGAPIGDRGQGRRASGVPRPDGPQTTGRLACVASPTPHSHPALSAGAPPERAMGRAVTGPAGAGALSCVLGGRGATAGGAGRRPEPGGRLHARPPLWQTACLCSFSHQGSVSLSCCQNRT